MKYEDFSNYTFSKTLTRDNDPSGVGLLLESFDEGDSESTFDSYCTHPSLVGLQNSLKPVPLSVYGCPICKEVYFDEQKALHCADVEKLMVQKFAGAKVGDWLKYEVLTSNRLDCWSDLDVGYKAFDQIVRFSYIYDGFRCGKILTIHTKSSYINGDTHERWSLVPESEVIEFNNAKKLEAIAKLQSELK